MKQMLAVYVILFASLSIFLSLPAVLAEEPDGAVATVEENQEASLAGYYGVDFYMMMSTTSNVSCTYLDYFAGTMTPSEVASIGTLIYSNPGKMDIITFQSDPGTTPMPIAVYYKNGKACTIVMMAAEPF